MMVTVRVASIDDAPSLLEIYGHYVANTAITFECNVPSLEEFRERIRSTPGEFIPFPKISDSMN